MLSCDHRCKRCAVRADAGRIIYDMWMSACDAALGIAEGVPTSSRGVMARNVTSRRLLSQRAPHFRFFRSSLSTYCSKTVFVVPAWPSSWASSHCSAWPSSCGTASHYSINRSSPTGCVTISNAAEADTKISKDPDPNMSLALQGTMFRYASKQGNCAFRTGASRCYKPADRQIRSVRNMKPRQIWAPDWCYLPGSHRRHLVLVGGLGDAMLFAPYVPLLAKRLDDIGWYVLGCWPVQRLMAITLWHDCVLHDDGRWRAPHMQGFPFSLGDGMSPAITGALCKQCCRARSRAGASAVWMKMPMGWPCWLHTSKAATNQRRDPLLLLWSQQGCGWLWQGSLLTTTTSCQWLDHQRRTSPLAPWKCAEPAGHGAGAHPCRALNRVSGCRPVHQPAGCAAPGRHHSAGTGVFDGLDAVRSLRARYPSASPRFAALLSWIHRSATRITSQWIRRRQAEFCCVSGWLARGALRTLHSGKHHAGPVRSAAPPCSCLHAAADAAPHHRACTKQLHAAICHAEMTMVRQSRHGASWQSPSLVVMTTTSASALATKSGRWVGHRVIPSC